MKKAVYGLCASLSAAFILTSCNPSPSYPNNHSSSPEGPAAAMSYTYENNTDFLLSDVMLDSYYAGQNDPAFEYFHHSSIKRFLSQWVKKETGDLENPQWDYESFTKINMLDHDLTDMEPDKDLYCLTFKGGKDRYGYVIAEYLKDDPSISNREVAETTPYQYDLKANKDEMEAALAKTDLDLSTAGASRIYLYDKEKKQADQAILFTDGKGDSYICRFGGASFEIEKRGAHA